MENTIQHSFNTQLDDRILWYDGDSSYKAKDILALTRKGITVNWVDEITSDIKSYNSLGSVQIDVKRECRPLTPDWNLPAPYDTLDPISYVIDKHTDIVQSISTRERDEREYRLASELTKYIDMNLIDVLRATIYIINTLTSSNTIWGIGRGSSVSSYVLYVIGVHDVDSFAYQLDIDDFLHD